LQQAERFIASQRCRRHKTGKELAQASTNQLIRNCRALFSVALKWKIVEANPFLDIEAPEPPQKRFHRLTPQEVAPSLRHKALYDVLLTTGARMNEVLSRTWADIDFEHGRMIISNREVTNGMPPFTIKAKKERTVPLSEGTIALLAQLREQAPEGVPYVFLTPTRYERVKQKWRSLRDQGKAWDDKYLTNDVCRNFKNHCHKAGIKPEGKLSIHTLRKNAGQNLADAGLPVNVVQTILGHSNPRTTLKYYSQVDAYHHKQITKSVEDRRSRGRKRHVSRAQKYVSGTYEPKSDDIHD